MRKNLITPLLFLSAFCACTATLPATSPEQSYLLHVECRNDLGSRQSVLFLLKQGKARDIKEDNSTGILVIEAAYFVEDNAVAVLQRIADDLQRMGSVLHVDLVDNHSLVRQPR